jgi:hypothetical protein
MKRNIILLVLLAAIACASGYLMSKASWIGRVGITFFYQQYNLLKIWWQGAIAVYLLFIALFSLHTYICSKASVAVSRAFCVVLLLAALAGGYFTYSDFTHNFAHNLLGRRFHFGFYAIWAGWALVPLNFLFPKYAPLKIDRNRPGQT